MKNRIINIFTNDTPVSKATKTLLKRKLQNSDFVVQKDFSAEAELIICIGGDGAFLEAIHTFEFPDIPFIGINTGHLGFFQEISPDQLDDFIFYYNQGKYRLQPLTTVQAIVTVDGKETVHKALNEIVIKGNDSYSIHLNISIGGSFIERFSGDGILIATPAGSTAYNYSLGGSIVDPRLKILQVTPIAPMNTTAYRSFTSSILLPSDLSLGICPESPQDYDVVVTTDGMEYQYSCVDEINVKFSETNVNLLRFESYDFWNKVKTKFL